MAFEKCFILAVWGLMNLRDVLKRTLPVWFWGIDFFWDVFLNWYSMRSKPKEFTIWDLNYQAHQFLLVEEIRRSPVEVGSLSHYLQGFIHPWWLFGISSINCTNHKFLHSTFPLEGVTWMSNFIPGHPEGHRRTEQPHHLPLPPPQERYTPMTWRTVLQLDLSCSENGVKQKNIKLLMPPLEYLNKVPTTHAFGFYFCNDGFLCGTNLPILSAVKEQKTEGWHLWPTCSVLWCTRRPPPEAEAPWKVWTAWQVRGIKVTMEWNDWERCMIQKIKWQQLVFCCWKFQIIQLSRLSEQILDRWSDWILYISHLWNSAQFINDWTSSVRNFEETTKKNDQNQRNPPQPP